MKRNYLLRPRIAGRGIFGLMMPRQMMPRQMMLRQTTLALVVAALLVGSMLAALGAGPDDTANATASNTGGQWQAFEGHAFADSRIVPTGVSLVACLGGCDEGYISEPVAIGQDGRYSSLKVDPGAANRSALPDADVITFWLVGHNDRVSAVQSWLFTGDGQTRELHLSFHKLPVPSRGLAASGGSAGAVTTDLTVPNAEELRLTPAPTPRSYVNSWSYAGVPALPGLTILVGFLIAVIGVALLVRRRRLTW